MAMGLAWLWRSRRAPPRDFLRARASFRARLPEGQLAAQHYVVFDLETTGLSPSRGDGIVAIGAVRVRDAAATQDCFATLVDPRRPIPPLATRFHGIDAARVAGAPDETAALMAFASFAGDAVLVAHNAAFDMTCLAAAEFRGAPAFANPALCSQVLSRWLDPQESDHSLDGVAARLGEIIPGRHDALGDARATAAILARLLPRADARGIDSLAELFRRTRMQALMAASAEHF
jgi:DNA polymerase III epsilon subunit-like protein